MNDVPVSRIATCACGQLIAACIGEPIRISVCHCLNCQTRSGSSFAAQARWPDAAVRVTGEFKTWTRTNDSGSRADFRFCPVCGSTVFYVLDAMPGVIAVAVGAFADPAFPAPFYSVYESRKHGWVAIEGGGVEHFD